MTARTSKRASGFTLLEVMVSLGILGLALVAIIDINGGAVRVHSYAKRVSIATMLAQAKMVELESEYIDEGFTSEFDQKIEGTFEEEGWADYKWTAEIIKPELDGANASAMVSGLVAQLGGLTENKTSAGGAMPFGMGIKPADMSGMAAAALGPMIETQMTVLSSMVEKAVREVRLEVYWVDGDVRESITVATHLVVLAPAGQPGGEPNDPEMAAATMAASSALSRTPGGTGPNPAGAAPPGYTMQGADVAISPAGVATGPGIPRPAWVPPHVPKPPFGAHYNPSLESNPNAPPYVWVTPGHK